MFFKCSEAGFEELDASRHRLSISCVDLRKKAIFIMSVIVWVSVAENHYGSWVSAMCLQFVLKMRAETVAPAVPPFPNLHTTAAPAVCFEKCGLKLWRLQYLPFRTCTQRRRLQFVLKMRAEIVIQNLSRTAVPAVFSAVFGLKQRHMQFTLKNGGAGSIFLSKPRQNSGASISYLSLWKTVALNGGTELRGGRVVVYLLGCCLPSSTERRNKYPEWSGQTAAQQSNEVELFFLSPEYNIGTPRAPTLTPSQLTVVPTSAVLASTRAHWQRNPKAQLGSTGPLCPPARPN
ncbi:hypothetical protein B0H13DRAFT_1850391 [Mycena leptocephala]|nr:hypothetical protein B0H13DRAFT_1850391 [Mycena leptocephala]